MTAMGLNKVLMSVIAVGKSAQPYFKNPLKPVAEARQASEQGPF